MSQEAELFAECLAHPDEDGPRLVWADHVGGKRGELVVVQCNLARRELGEIERARCRDRERELLERHAIEWAGDIGKHALRWSFRRGFIESVKVDALDTLDARALRAAAPIRAITVRPLLRDQLTARELEPLRGIAALAIVDNPMIEQLDDLAPLLATFGLRAFAMDNLTSGGLDAMLEIVRASPIEYLRLRHVRITPRELDRLCAAAPRLASLDLEPSPFSEPAPVTNIQEPRSRRDMIAIAARYPLRALRLGPVTTDDVSPLIGSVAATTLERLGYDLASSSLEPLGRVHVAATLPRLRMTSVTRGDELIHPSADALLDIGTPWYLSAPAFWVVRLDRAELFEVPAKPIDEETYIGRGMDLAVRIHSGTVARRHARLTWREDYHLIEDMGSTNGIVVEGSRIQSARLDDGHTLRLGETTIRYFVGPGAEQRARAAALLGT